MSQTLNFTLVGAASAKRLSAGVPAHFQDAVDRHQNNPIALSVALKAAASRLLRQVMSMRRSPVFRAA